MSDGSRLRMGVVGAGRVGAVLANALRAVGHEIVAVSGSSPGTLERVEALLPGVPVLDPLEVATAADLTLVCVPDDVIAPMVRWLADQGAFRAGSIVVHTSGRHGLDVLAPASAAGAIPVAIHPAMTFTGTSLDLQRLIEAPFAVTAPTPVLPIGQALVVEIGGDPIVLPDAVRPIYHAALAHAANHLVTLLVQAQELLTGAGVQDAARLLSPLVHAALGGALRSGGEALTGPISRGDLETVSRHLSALAQSPGDLEVVESYRTLARATTELALRSHRISPQTAAQAHRLLRADAVPADSEGDQVRVVTSIEEMRRERRAMAGEVAVVMTMGALHAGHLDLVRAARTAADHVIVTVFVNPTQFGDAADLAAYPRTLEADVEALAAMPGGGADLVFAPSVEEMYPRPVGVHVSAGEMGTRWEGASRPGHFDGVLTVVSKFLGILEPEVAVFGQKDAQQLALVRRLVAELNLPTWILSVPVAREADGLAMSSRNARLSETGRTQALALSRSVAVAERYARAGAGADDLLAAARAELQDAPGVTLDYADLVDPDTFEALDEAAPASPEDGSAEPAPPREAVYVVAAVVDGVRLLDTTALRIEGARALGSMPG